MHWICLSIYTNQSDAKHKTQCLTSHIKTNASSHLEYNEIAELKKEKVMANDGKVDEEIIFGLLNLHYSL